ncbi:MAG: septum formation initiator family protein [Thermacetogeniaceae bacterium]
MVIAEKSYERLSVNDPGQHVKTKKKQRVYLHYRVVALTLVLLAVGLLYTYQHNRIIYLGYRINAAKQRIAMIQTDNKKLELKIAGLQSPERVERIAREKLGMKEPDGILLAAGIASKPESSETSSEKANEGRAQKSIFGLVTGHLIERAEALPR